MATIAPSDVHLSSRQRKQVFMHSDIFYRGQTEDADSQKPSASMYSPAQQRIVYKKVQAVVEVPQRPPDMLLPSPLEMKLTETYGHDTVAGRPTQDGEARCSTANDFAGRPLIKPTDAPNIATSIPHEFWATGSKLQWMDTRAELCGRRKAWADVPFDRKHQEMASTVMGTAAAGEPKRPTRQDRSPEIRATELDDPFRQDSCFTRREEAGAKASASDRYHRNLASNGIQPSEASSGRDLAASSGAMRAEVDKSEMRRRSERNFSDLFETGGVSRRAPRSGSPQAADVQEAAASVIKCEDGASTGRPEEVRGRYARSSRSQTVLGESTVRSCWDPPAGYNARSKQRNAAQGRLEDAAMTAQGRKRVNMSSAAFVAGMGMGGDPATAKASERPKRDVWRSPSPDLGTFRGPPLSARDRYRASMQTSLFS